MQLVICASCSKEYDKSAFGAGHKYCTKQCKYTKNNTVSMALRYRGRKRRFQRVSYHEMHAILDQLGLWGFKITQKLPTKEAVPRVFNVKVGMMDVPIVIGGTTKENKRAHVAVWFENGHMRFLSTCIKTKNLVAVADGLKTRNMVTLTPCFHHECLRCRNAQILREVQKRVEAHYDVEKGYVD